MIIGFTKDKQHVLFQYEDITEYKAVSGFPAFSRLETSFVCPPILPVAFNIVERCKANFKNVKVTTELDEWLKQPFKLLSLPDDFKFHTKPMDFQEIALRFIYTIGSAGLLLDPGMGKSKVVLDYIALKKFNRTYVICPAALLFVWEDEIHKHRPDLSYHVVTSTNWVKELPKLIDKQVVIINYNKAVILKHRLKELSTDFVYIDEFLIKDHKTSRSKAITELSRGIPYKSGGSGTLINNTPLDAFSPLRYLQPSLVGGSYTNFADKFTVTRKLSKNNPSDHRKMIVGFRGHNEIKQMLESTCIVMTKDVWLKLPEKIFTDLFCQMSQEQKDAYYSLQRNYFVNIQGRDVLVDNPLVMMSKLYQISQGFIYVNKETEEDTDILELLDGEVKLSKAKKTSREIVFFEEQPKIEKLRELLTTKLKDRKCIIWFNLDGEYLLIEKLLHELGDEFLSIRGGDKKIGDKVRMFNKTPRIKRLVCQAKAVNYGITVLGTKTEDLDEETLEMFPDVQSTVSDQVFYSLNFSLEVFLQQQDRTHRLGQLEVCNYYRLFANNPLERKIRDIIHDKVTLKLSMLVDVAHTLLDETIQ